MMDALYFFMFLITKIIFFHVVLRFLQKMLISGALWRATESPIKYSKLAELNEGKLKRMLALRFPNPNIVIYANKSEPPMASGAMVNGMNDHYLSATFYC